MKEAKRKMFEEFHHVPDDAEWHDNIGVYRYKQYPSVDHPINENWESFQGGWYSYGENLRDQE